MALDKSYRESKFIPPTYLNEQYGEIEQDEKIISEFQHILYRNLNLKKGARLLEIGGGPTINQLISASSKIRNIIFTDYLNENLGEVYKWCKGDKKAFNWDNFFKIVLRLENQPVNKDSLKKIKNRLKKAIKKIVRFDLNKHTLRDIKSKPFEVVSVNYCPESITDNFSSYYKLMKKITPCIKQDGHLIMTLLKKRSSYRVGSHVFKVFPIDEFLLRKTLTKLGFTNIVILSLDIERSTGHNAVMAVSAKLSN